MTFRIPIGDWSGRGHRFGEQFTASAEGDISRVREAYFAAKEKLPEELHPENICSDYEDDSIDVALREKVLSLSSIALGEDDGSYVMPYDLAAYIVWFIDQGDPSLNVMLDEAHPELNFIGLDEKGRHIGSLGYGLFS